MLGNAPRVFSEKVQPKLWDVFKPLAVHKHSLKKKKTGEKVLKEKSTSHHFEEKKGYYQPSF